MDDRPASSSFSSFRPIPFAQLSPVPNTFEGRYLHATVILLWPYSSTSKQFSILLSEPDFRLRSDKGQVRVVFCQRAAESVARSQVGVGDTVFLGLHGAKWEPCNPKLQSQLGNVDGDLIYSDDLLIEVQRESKPLSIIGISSKPEDTGICRPDEVPITPKRSVAASNNSWSSPTFVKTPDLPFTSSLIESQAEDDGYIPGRGRKRTKFGRPSSDWVFISAPPSPERSIGEQDNYWELDSEEHSTQSNISPEKLSPRLPPVSPDSHEEDAGFEVPAVTVLIDSSDKRASHPFKVSLTDQSMELANEREPHKENQIETSRDSVGGGETEQQFVSNAVEGRLHTRTASSPYIPMDSSLRIFSSTSQDNLTSNTPDKRTSFPLATPNSNGIFDQPAVTTGIDAQSEFDESEADDKSFDSIDAGESPSSNVEMNQIRSAATFSKYSYHEALSGISGENPNVSSVIKGTAMTLDDDDEVLSADGFHLNKLPDVQYEEGEHRSPLSGVHNEIDVESIESYGEYSPLEDKNLANAAIEHGTHYTEDLTSKKVVEPEIIVIDDEDSQVSEDDLESRVDVTESHSPEAPSSEENFSDASDKRPHFTKMDSDIGNKNAYTMPTHLNESQALRQEVYDETHTQLISVNGSTTVQPQHGMFYDGTMGGKHSISNEPLQRGHYLETPDNSQGPHGLLGYEYNFFRPSSTFGPNFLTPQPSQLSSQFIDKTDDDVYAESVIKDDATHTRETRSSESVRSYATHSADSSFVETDTDVSRRSPEESVIEHQELANHGDSCFAPLDSLAATKPKISEEFSGLRTKLSYYSPLCRLSEYFNSFVDTISVVTEVRPIKRARSGPKDYCVVLKVTDKSLEGSTRMVQLFRRYRNVLPTPTRGDVILLQNSKVQSFNHAMTLVSTEKQCTWALFPQGSDQDPEVNGAPVEFGPEEEEYVAQLRTWYNEEGAELVAKNTLPQSSRRDKKRKAGRMSQGGLGSLSPINPMKRIFRDQRGPRRSSGRITVHELRHGRRYLDIGSASDSESIHELRNGTLYCHEH